MATEVPCEYVRFEENVVVEPQVVPVSRFYVNMQEPRKRKFGCCLCWTCILVVLLIIFLFPRDPTVKYHYTELTEPINECVIWNDDPIDDFNATSRNITGLNITGFNVTGDCWLEGKFTFLNDNYYTVTWSDFDTKVYFLNEEGLWQYMGKYQRSKPFTTSARSSKNLEVQLSVSFQEVAEAAIEALIKYDVLYIKITGTVHAKGEFRDFGTMNLNFGTWDL